VSRIKPRIAVNLVGVLVLAVLTVGWVVVNLVAPQVINKPFEVTADFASSGGVFTNQEVTYRGVLIGKVGDLTLNEDGVDIQLLIDPEWENEIPTAVTARVQSKSAVGEQFVNLVPTGGVSDMLSDGDSIPRGQTELPVDFQKLLRTLDAVLGDVPPGKTRRLIQNLADGVGGRGDEIASILESLGTLSKAFASVAPEQQRLLDNATKTGSAFLDSKDEFVGAMKAADDVLTALGDEPQELENLFIQNDRLARRGMALIEKHGDNIHAGIRALGNFVDFQLEEVDAIQDSLTYVPAFLHAIEDSSIYWESPDGRKFYRIRIGIVSDNQIDSWPCKYRLPNNYERFPHEREFREPITLPECRPQTTTAPSSSSSSLIDALKILLAEEAGRDILDDEVGGDVPGRPGWGWLPPTQPQEPPDDPEPSPSPSDPSSPSPSPSEESGSAPEGEDAAAG
jgi:phospholipid/cholesterol/gamma-HCH transport system substrate-binding protein